MKRVRNWLNLGVFILLICLTLPENSVLGALHDEIPYFPTNGWRRSTPEEQGMNSNKLEEMYDLIVDENIGTESVIIVRNGYLVYEEYFEYYDYSNIHQMFSVSKSVISLLVGVANTTGFIPNLDQPVLEIFSDRNFTNVDANKQALTIRHLLKMQSGIQCNQGDAAYYTDYVDIDNYDLFTNTSPSSWPSAWPYNMEDDAFQLTLRNETINWILDRPMAHPPGTYFRYSGLDSHLLSAIIQNKTGMTAEEFAIQYLFGPLNITEYLWWNHLIGITMGQTGLWLRPIDMVKIGYLCLNNGLWNTTQIMPETWIQESTQDYKPFKSQYGYGYQWWTDKKWKYYSAEGLGGQTIAVKLDADLVVSITSSNYNTPGVSVNSWHLLVDYILPSLSISDTTTTETTMDSEAQFLDLPFILITIGLFIAFKKKKGKRVS